MAVKVEIDDRLATFTINVRLITTRLGSVVLMGI
jgi:hypothetical protein